MPLPGQILLFRSFFYLHNRKLANTSIKLGAVYKSNLLQLKDILCQSGVTIFLSRRADFEYLSVFLKLCEKAGLWDRVGDANVDGLDEPSSPTRFF